MSDSIPELDEILPPMANVDTPYIRDFTRDEIIEIMSDPVRLAEMQAKANSVPLSMDSKTFQPYKVIDGLRYSLELAQDIAAQGY